MESSLGRLPHASIVDLAAAGIANDCALRGLVEALLREVTESLGIERAWLLCPSQPYERLWLYDSGKTECRQSKGGDRGLVRSVAFDCGALLVNEPHREAHFSAETDAPWGGAPCPLAAVPLLDASGPLGALAIAKPPGSLLDAADLAALESLAPVMSMALRIQDLASAAGPKVQAHHLIEALVQERTAVLSRGKREWELTFDAICEPLFLLDGFVIRRANLALAAFVGAGIRSIIGKRCHEVIASSATPCRGCPLGAPLPSHGELSLRGKTYRISTFPLPPGNSSIVHYRDLTEERRLGQQLSQTERMASVGRLAAGAAHEINNPLAFVVSNLETLELTLGALSQAVSRLQALRSLVRSGRVARALALLRSDDLLPVMAASQLAEAPQVLAECRVGVLRIRTIVDALRELALETSTVRVLENPVDVLHRAVTRAGEDARVLVEVQSSRRIPLEPHALEVALANIVRNAVQASCPEDPICARIAEDESAIVIEVRDNGCGMSKEVLTRVFDPFFTTRIVGSGVGLGLTAAYGIVTRHGGTIAVASEEGRGTVVTVRLPART
ncbi:MAG TPA: hypothetical protein DFS52_19950 [Myxococcales bacterium]|jgi:signal transduction histidine kinase|nr:hypothetical protein [Myxococcales bacterium]